MERGMDASVWNWEGRREQRAAVARWVAVAALYCVADLALNQCGFSDGWTIFWPLNGVTVALLSGMPRRRWLAFLLAAQLGTGLGELTDGNRVMMEMWLRACSLLEVWVSAAMLPEFTGLETWLREPKLVRRFLLALLVGPWVSGLPAAWALWRLGGFGFWNSWNQWASADVLGITLATPVTLALMDGRTRAAMRAWTPGELWLPLTLTLAVAVAMFRVSEYPLLFLLFPVLLYVDSRLRFAGAAIAMLMTAVIAVYCTTKGWGPFGRWPAALQMPREAGLRWYLEFHVVALLPLSLVSMERRRVAAELAGANEQLRLLASEDSLTGLPNRRVFRERLELAYARAKREGMEVSLLMLDVDRFKQFNDLYGHLKGDRCLREVGTALRGRMRRGTDLVARYGGEEFVALLPGQGAEPAWRMAEDLREAVMALGIRHERGVEAGVVTISVGCATLDLEVDGTEEELVGRADVALYQAKAAGRNGVAVA